MEKREVKKLVNEYLAYVRSSYIKKGRLMPPAKNTIYTYRRMLINMMESGLSAEEFGNQYCTGKKPSSRALFVKIAKPFYDWMVRTDRCPDNPLKDWVVPIIPKEHRETYDLVELEKLRNIMMTKEQAILLDILIDTACRRHELTTITEADLPPPDSDKSPCIRLHSKGGKLIYPLLRPETLEAIRARFKASPRTYLFETAKRPGLPPSTKQIDRLFKDIMQANRITKKGIGLHTIRRSVITEAIREGVPIPLVQKLVGHSSLTTTAIYIHLVQNDIDKLHNYALFQSRDKRFNRKGGDADETTK
jgi:integrase